MLDRRWVQKIVLGLTDRAIEEIHEGKMGDKIADAEMGSAGAEEGGGKRAAAKKKVGEGCYQEMFLKMASY